MKRLTLVVGTLLLAAGLIAPAVSAGAAGNRTWPGGRSRLIALRGASWKEDSRGSAKAVKLFRQQGYLVPDQAAYERAKAAAAARVGQSRVNRSASRVAPKMAGDPDISPAWEGLNDDRVSPPDTTGAIGPTRYVELTNLKYAIYDRNGGQLSTGGLAGLAGDPFDDLSLSDPQIIWDPGTNRFYYVILSVATNTLDVGFSKTASPTSASSWCKYFADFGYGSKLPDYPKLGETRDFLLIGVNVYLGFGYVQSDVDWITKPPAGTKCPTGSSFRIGRKQNIKLHDTKQAFTPVPANQTDTSGTGYVVATPDASDGAPHDFIDTFKVTKAPNGSAVFGAAVAHNVNSYSLPANASQSGTSQVLDTLDARLTQAVSAVDPFRGKTAVWTQHTVAGGAGSEVRWYEIDPTVNALLQPQGAATSVSLYAFNGAISPDRKVSGTTRRFGDAAVAGFNTSSASDFVRIQMVSKWRDNAQSAFVEVKASPGFNDDFSCYPAHGGPPCRWGDYSGATPDPASNAFSNHGRVWLSNQWNVSSATSDDVDWRTYNWGTNPAPFVILTGPSPLFHKVTSFPVSWELGNQATQANINVRLAPWNGGFGPYTPWKIGVPAGSDTYVGAPGNTYCFQAEALDAVPQSWGKTAARCTVVPLDDRKLTASAGWARRTGTGFFLGTFTRTTHLGKSLTRTGIHAKSAQLMVEKCPTCGSIKIYWNGSLKHTYSLHLTSVHKMVYLSAVRFSSVHTGTLKIVVSSSGKPVIIDALGVSRV